MQIKNQLISNKTVIENTARYDNKHEYTDILIKKVFKLLKLDEFIGIQPMEAPVGLIYKLEYISDIHKDANTLTLGVINKPIEAKSIVPKSVIDLRDMDKSVNLYGDYMIDRYLHFMAVEICFELHREAINLLYDNSTKINYRIESDDNSTDIMRKLYSASRVVGINSRRGKANKWILPKSLFDRIETESLNGFCPINSHESDIQKVGTINNGAINIYVSIHNTVAILQYKGDSGEIDTNTFFTPYTHILNVDKNLFLSNKIRYNIIPGDSNYTVSLQIR